MLHVMNKGGSLFDRQLRSCGPFGPARVVPVDVPVAQKMLQNEIRLAGLMAGTAVHHNRGIQGRNDAAIAFNQLRQSA